MNPPNKDDETNHTTAAATNDEAAVLGAATTSPSATTTIMSSLPRGPDDRNDNSAAAAKAAIGQDSHGDDVQPPPAAMAGSGLEIIEDEDGPLLPPSMSAMPFDGDSPDLDAARTAASRYYVGKPTKAWPEEIKDNTGPDLPVSMMEFTDSKKMEPIVTRPPRPINIAEIGNEKDASKKGQPPPRRQIALEDSLVIPPSGDMEGEVAQTITNRRGGRAEEFIVNANASPSNPGAHRNEDDEANVQNGNPEDTLPRPDLDRDSTFKVPEAVLVEEVDDEVYMGTRVEPLAPPLPWWKQRRMRFLLSLMFAIVAISAIIIGSLLSSEGIVAEPVADPIVIVVVASNAPSSSTAPSSSPTLTKSNSPTALYCISITIDYDEKPRDTDWDLYRAVGDDWEMVKERYGKEGYTSYSESFCLEEGEYRFNILDFFSPYDGICCDHGEGSYSVTVDGTLIVEGGEFKYQELTYFSVPFVAGTNVTTQYDN